MSNGEKCSCVVSGELEQRRMFGADGPMGVSLVGSIHSGVCPSCGKHGCRLHWYRTDRKNRKAGEKDGSRYYCDCECGHGRITDWHDMPADAVKDWNSRASARAV